MRNRNQNISFLSIVAVTWNGIKRIFKLFSSLQIEWRISRLQISRSPKTLLIVRLDGLGDYILFRNYFQTIRNSNKYHDYKITFCGNELYKEISEQYDKDVIDESIWITPQLFRHDRSYRYSKMKFIHDKGFEVVLNPVSSRESLNEDAIVRITGATTKVGWYGDLLLVSSLERSWANRSYTHLIDNASAIYFEYYRSKYFFEKALETTLAVQRPSLPRAIALKDKPPFAIIGAGANYSFRRWSINNYIQVSDYLFNRYGIHSHYVGSENEKPMAREMDSSQNRSYIIHHFGDTSLRDIVDIIQRSTIVISNETGIAHVAQALDTPTIVISNGNHFGRFTEYPKELHANVLYAYPPQLINSGLSFPELVQEYKYTSDLDINTIGAEAIYLLIDQIFTS
jgi:ADP-heptose:LPS heptosyltransferase